MMYSNQKTNALQKCREAEMAVYSLARYLEDIDQEEFRDVFIALDKLQTVTRSIFNANAKPASKETP